METRSNELDELLKRSMQLDNAEVPEPSVDRLNVLRNAIKRRGLKNKGIVRLLNVNIKLYQAVMATAAVVALVIVLRPAACNQGHTNSGGGSIDTASVFGGSSIMKHDSFLVKNSDTVY